MRQVNIPTIGTILTLAEPWTFTVRNERRNASLVDLMGKLVPDCRWGHPLGGDYRQPAPDVEHTLPAGTVLRVDRIYIRKGYPDFDSVTFFAPGLRSTIRTVLQSKAVRFFAPLRDVNTMQVV